MNNYQTHVLILPEDDAIRQMAIGFLDHPDVQDRKIKVLSSAGGWKHAVDQFTTDIAPTMNRFKCRHVVLIIDLDSRTERLQDIRQEFAAEYADRVFILGIASEAEDLKRALNLTFESIGEALADNCRRGTNDVWGHDLLSANASEIERLRGQVCPFLFESSAQ